MLSETAARPAVLTAKLPEAFIHFPIGLLNKLGMFVHLLYPVRPIARRSRIRTLRHLVEQLRQQLRHTMLQFPNGRFGGAIHRSSAVQQLVKFRQPMVAFV